MPFDYTNHALSNDEIATLYRSRGSAALRGIHAAMITNEASQSQLEGMRALLGQSHSVAAAIGSNCKLRDYARERMTAGIFAFKSRDPGMVGRIDIFDLEPREQGKLHWDLKEARRLHRSIIKHLGENAIANTIIEVVSDEPQLRMGVLSWNVGNSQGASPAASAKSRRKSDEKVASAVVRRENLNTKEELSAAVAMLWELNPQPNLGPYPSGIEGPRVKNKHRQLDLKCALIQARLPILRSMFGIGDGDAIVKSVAYELKARARSFDMAKTSPIQAEGVEAFISKLPAAAGGALVSIPTIKPL